MGQVSWSRSEELAMARSPSARPGGIEGPSLPQSNGSGLGVRVTTSATKLVSQAGPSPLPGSIIGE